MSIQFDFTKTKPKSYDTLVLTVQRDEDKNLKLGSQAGKIDSDLDNFIIDVAERSSTFKGKAGQSLLIRTPKNVAFKNVILLGLGRDDEKDPYSSLALDIEEAGGKLHGALKSAGAEKVVILPEFEGDLGISHVSANLISGLKLAAYSFDTYKDKNKDKKNEDDKIELAKITFVSDAPEDVRDAGEHLAAEIEGVKTARDLGNEPANRLYPDSFATFIQNELDPLGVKVTILDEKDLKKLGAEAFLAVGQGSDKPPRMVIMEWKGDKNSKEFANAFVGKGITFDTGGISIKPSSGMQDMKMDMCGAATVVGLMKSLALRKAKTNIVAAVALAENMPSHNAYRPGDIIGSLAGKSIEILNTDAEGRLVLVDTLTHIQREYKPETLINLATLTGAIMVGLGRHYAGAFVNDDDLWALLEKASRVSGEKLWRMPLDKEFKKSMESEMADLKNLAGVPYGGACTAAGFLEHFIEDDVKWTHLDIAGVAWGEQPKSIYPKGATGYGVRLLNRYIESELEKTE